jgi:hypothetical protein
MVEARGDGSHLASRAVIVNPEKRRAAQTLSPRVGPANSGHRSDQQARLGADRLIERSLGHFDEAEYRRQLEVGVGSA